VQGFDEDRTNGTPLQVNDTNQRQASLRASGFVGGGASWRGDRLRVDADLRPVVLRGVGGPDQRA
jgi:hypothetical protein